MKLSPPHLFLIPILTGRTPVDLPEDPVKMINILEPRFKGRFPDRDRVVGQQEAGLLQSGLDQLIHRPWLFAVPQHLLADGEKFGKNAGWLLTGHFGLLLDPRDQDQKLIDVAVQHLLMVGLAIEIFLIDFFQEPVNFFRVVRIKDGAVGKAEFPFFQHAAKALSDSTKTAQRVFSLTEAGRFLEELLKLAIVFALLMAGIVL